MSEYEFNAERFCRVRARSARAVRNFDDEQNFLKVADRVRQLEYEVDVWKKKPAMNVQRKYDALKDAAVHIYNSGYHAGHHYTVDGGYVDIHSNDMDTYHAEEVAELLAALVGEEGK